MKYTLEKEFKFEAAHMLPLHNGKCRNLHGHSWRGKIVVSGCAVHGNGPKSGMLVDFSDIKKIIEPTIEELLDHRYLNESIPELENPTSEALAKFLFDLWLPMVHKSCTLAKLESVVIYETCTSCCTYSL